MEQHRAIDYNARRPFFQGIPRSSSRCTHHVVPFNEVSVATKCHLPLLQDTINALQICSLVGCISCPSAPYILEGCLERIALCSHTKQLGFLLALRCCSMLCASIGHGNCGCMQLSNGPAEYLSFWKAQAQPSASQAWLSYCTVICQLILSYAVSYARPACFFQDCLLSTAVSSRDVSNSSPIQHCLQQVACLHYYIACHHLHVSIQAESAFICPTGLLDRVPSAVFQTSPAAAHCMCEAIRDAQTRTDLAPHMEGTCLPDCPVWSDTHAEI